MSDNLRNRIAAVLQAQPPVRLQSQSDWLDWTENRADAVIAELGLKRMEMGRACSGVPWIPLRHTMGRGR